MTAIGSPNADRAALLANRSTTGGEWCQAWSDKVDDWLRALFASAAGEESKRIALVAVGGYGRRELCPGSDIDVVLLHAGQADVGVVAERLWYPVWDAGFKLGHAVRSNREAIALAQDDLDTATSLLDTRFLAGDQALAADLVERATAQWRRRARKWLAELADSVVERHIRRGEVAFMLEPDLKDGRGGLRDVHALAWADAARLILFPADRESLASAYATVLAARVELHRSTVRAGNQLSLQEQDAVAGALGDRDADALMGRLAGAARTIAWTSDDTWARIRSSLAGPLGRLARRDRPVGAGLVLRDGEIHVEAAASPADDPALVLRAAAETARHLTVIDRASLERLAAETRPLPDPWPPEAREAIIELLMTGDAAVGVIEALDQRGLWVKVLPEWLAVRSRPQRNAYHRFTVDRHLVETAAGAAALADRVRRPDLLVLGALLHDLGKGAPGDHSEAGAGLAEAIARRMGMADADVDMLVRLVRHHLLLPETATRRDLDDPATIDRVASAVGSVEVLGLLAALTEADALATGPAAWGPWKATLVRDLVARVEHVLGGGAAHEVIGADFPTPAQRELLDRREQVIVAGGDELVLVTRDRPGLMSRVAGVMAVHGVAVLAAWVHSTDDGMALEQYRVESTIGPVVPWDKVRHDLERALDGRLAVHARVEARRRRYARRPSVPDSEVVTKVTFDNASSERSTVVEVLAPDAVGLLHRVSRALAELDLDIRSAKVQTLGPQVIDAFYVRGFGGAKITDADHLAEIERAILQVLEA
ncbi:MAG: [protein-PII] uridylyltransferase [Acidimicrobiales bacterium]